MSFEQYTNREYQQNPGQPRNVQYNSPQHREQVRNHYQIVDIEDARAHYPPSGRKKSHDQFNVIYINNAESREQKQKQILQGLNVPNKSRQQYFSASPQSSKKVSTSKMTSNQQSTTAKANGSTENPKLQADQPKKVQSTQKAKPSPYYSRNYNEKREKQNLTRDKIVSKVREEKEKERVDKEEAQKVVPVQLPKKKVRRPNKKKAVPKSPQKETTKVSLPKKKVISKPVAQKKQIPKSVKKEPELETVLAHQLTLNYVKDRRDIYIDIDGILDLSSSVENAGTSQEEIEEEIDDEDLEPEEDEGSEEEASDEEEEDFEIEENEELCEEAEEDQESGVENREEDSEEEEGPIETNYLELESQTEHKYDSKSLEKSETSDSSSTIVMPEYKVREDNGRQSERVETVEPENTQTEEPVNSQPSPDNDENRGIDQHQNVYTQVTNDFYKIYPKSFQEISSRSNLQHFSGENSTPNYIEIEEDCSTPKEQLGSSKQGSLPHEISPPQQSEGKPSSLNKVEKGSHLAYEESPEQLEEQAIRDEPYSPQLEEISEQSHKPSLINNSIEEQIDKASGFSYKDSLSMQPETMSPEPPSPAAPNSIEENSNEPLSPDPRTPDKETHESLDPKSPEPKTPDPKSPEHRSIPQGEPEPKTPDHNTPERARPGPNNNSKDHKSESSSLQSSTKYINSPQKLPSKPLEHSESSEGLANPVKKLIFSSDQPLREKEEEVEEEKVPQMGSSLVDTQPYKQVQLPQKVLEVFMASDSPLSQKKSEFSLQKFYMTNDMDQNKKKERKPGPVSGSSSVSGISQKASSHQIQFQNTEEEKTIPDLRNMSESDDIRRNISNEPIIQHLIEPRKKLDQFRRKSEIINNRLRFGNETMLITISDFGNPRCLRKNIGPSNDFGQIKERSVEDSIRSMAKKTSRKISMSSAVSQGDPRTEAFKLDNEHLDDQSSRQSGVQELSVMSQKETSPGVSSSHMEERDKEDFEQPDDSNRELLITPSGKTPAAPMKKMVSFVGNSAQNSSSQTSKDSLLGLLRQNSKANKNSNFAALHQNILKKNTLTKAKKYGEELQSLNGSIKSSQSKAKIKITEATLNYKQPEIKEIMNIIQEKQSKLMKKYQGGYDQRQNSEQRQETKGQDEEDYIKEKNQRRYGVPVNNYEVNTRLKKLQFFEKQFANNSNPRVQYFRRQMNQVELLRNNQLFKTLEENIPSQRTNSGDLLGELDQYIESSSLGMTSVVGLTPKNEKKKQEKNIWKQVELRVNRINNTGWTFNDFLNKLIIMPKSNFYIVWNIFGLFFALIESILYPFIMAQGLPDSFSHPIVLMIICSNTFFAFDIILHFFVAVCKEGESEDYIMDLQAISRMYIHGDFSEDLILTLPLGFLGRFFVYFEILHLIKIFRLKNIKDILSPQFFMPQIRNLYQNKLQGVLTDERKMNNISQSNNFIMQRLQAQNIFYTLRIGFNVFAVNYLCGVIWYELVKRFLSPGLSEDNFITYFYPEHLSSQSKQLISSYFAFTTLTTCGFGDIVPITDSERLCCSIFLLFGVAIYSYIGDKFAKMVIFIKNFDNEYDESFELQRFLLLFKKFNSGQNLKKDIENSLIEFFDYKWKNDRNYCIQTAIDRQILSELPYEVQLRIFYDFLYQDFFRSFHRLFKFKINVAMNYKKQFSSFLSKKEMNTKVLSNINKFSTGKWQRYSRYPYYTQKDPEYQTFLMKLIENLEPRYFGQNTLLFRELDEIQEFYFVLAGLYDVGYEINNKRQYRLRFGSKTLIGAINVVLQIRSQIIVKTKSRLNCFGYRKQNWHKLMKQFPEFEKQLIISIYNDYEHKVRRPLKKKKEIQVDEMMQRADYNQILVLAGKKQSNKERLDMLMHFKGLMDRNSQVNRFKMEQDLFEYHKIIKNIEDRINKVTAQFHKVIYKCQEFQFDLYQAKWQQLQHQKHEEEQKK